MQVPRKFSELLYVLRWMFDGFRQGVSWFAYSRLAVLCIEGSPLRRIPRGCPHASVEVHPATPNGEDNELLVRVVLNFDACKTAANVHVGGHAVLCAVSEHVARGEFAAVSVAPLSAIKVLVKASEHFFQGDVRRGSQLARDAQRVICVCLRHN